jgi:hypothetical protein
MKTETDYEFLNIRDHKGGKVAIFSKKEKKSYNWFEKFFGRKDSVSIKDIEIFFPVRLGINFKSSMTLFPSGAYIGPDELQLSSLLSMEGID